MVASPRLALDNPAMTADPPGVLIAEDDVLLREGLARLLEDEGFHVIDQAGNASALLALAHRHRPDLVILDIRMPPTHTTEGLDVARTIRAEMPETAIVVLSAHAEVEQATDLLAYGERSGYLLKSRVTDVDEFIATLRRVIGGAAVVDPILIQQLVAAHRAEDPLEDLSPREREVLALMAEGRSNAGIAKELWVTDSTVEKHVHAIFMKLRIPETGDDHRRVLAVIEFLRAG
jgi:DNA-binding NarL/FixJ family response regulator